MRGCWRPPTRTGSDQPPGGRQSTTCLPPVRHSVDIRVGDDLGVPGQLIVSVSGISDRTLTGVDEFRRQLDGRGVPVSLFVAPRRKHGYRLESDPTTLEWLRHWRAHGDAIVLHGFDEAATKRRRSEFAVLGAHEANLRLIAADRALERIGMRTRLFAAPGWAVSAGTVTALPRSGFRLLIGRHESTDLIGGGVRRSRLIGIGAGFPKGSWWHRSVGLLAGRAARRGQPVRLAVAAGQLGKDEARHVVLDAVDTALDHGCTPAVYHWEPAAACRIRPESDVA